MRTATKRRLLALPSTDRLRRALTYLLSENEFLSPGGIRSMSKYYQDHPYVFHCEGHETTVRYSPGTANRHVRRQLELAWPVWVSAQLSPPGSLGTLHHFYGDSFQVEFPTGSGKQLNLDQVAPRTRRAAD